MAALAADPEPLRHRLDTVLARLAATCGPVPVHQPQQMADDIAAVIDGVLLPPRGVGETAALDALTGVLAAGAANPADPRCAGHLHCPPLAVAVAADTAVSVLNQSLDSWDQGPAAVALEPYVVTELARLVGYPPDTADGVLTTGGTESNLMGLMFARDRALPGAQATGVGGARLRIVCSEIAHFSVQRSAALLGLGENAVVTVPVDRASRMDVQAARQACLAAERDGQTIAAIVATAGTTDFGSIDPLPELAELARSHGAWLHVDAAYGGGALFSDRLAPLLDGLPAADSVGLDLHKLGWQPVPAGAIVTRDAAAFASLARHVAYLNAPDDEDAGMVSRLGRSLRTTRRLDAFKLAVTFRALGREGLGALVDACHDAAHYAASCIAAHDALELTAEPVLTTVVFRYRGTDAVNAALRRRLLTEGRAVIGRTEHAGRIHLKLTLLNPHVTHADIDALLADIVAAGREETP